MKMPTWSKHPDVRSGGELSRGERAADQMKKVMATFPALFAVLGFIGVWMLTNGGGVDLSPWIMLNLFLSCFAALQCFVLLIASRRGERISYEVAMSTLKKVESLEEGHAAILAAIGHDIPIPTGCDCGNCL